MLAFLSKQNGNSLVELMIAMTLGLASITAMASLVGHGIALNSSLLATSRLEEEMNAVVTVISHDLKRAGYFSNTKEMVEDPKTISNPFDNSVIVAAFGNEPINSCINFAYDRNKNGILDTGNGNENYGYRLRNKAIEIRLDGALCDQSGWHDLTDSKIVEVKELHFGLQQMSIQQVKHTKVNIELFATLKKHPNISRRVNTSVLIENYE